MKVVRTFVPLLALAATLAACRTAPVVASGSVGPRAAVLGFLDAVRRQNRQAVADHWGTSDGPARDRMSAAELEQRVYVMMRCLRHDSVRVRNEVSGDNRSRVVHVDLHLADMTRQTAFTAVPASGGRWFVEQIDMEPVRDICARR